MGDSLKKYSEVPERLSFQNYGVRNYHDAEDCQLILIWNYFVTTKQPLEFKINPGSRRNREETLQYSSWQHQFQVVAVQERKIKILRRQNQYDLMNWGDVLFTWGQWGAVLMIAKILSFLIPQLSHFLNLQILDNNSIHCIDIFVKIKSWHT
jgi:hypothetical protein